MAFEVSTEVHFLSFWESAYSNNNCSRLEKAPAEYIFNNYRAPFGIAVSSKQCPVYRNEPCTVFYIAKAMYIIRASGSCCRIPGEYTSWPATQGYVPYNWPGLMIDTGIDRPIPNSPYSPYPEYILQSSPEVRYYPVPDVIPRNKAPPGVIKMTVPAILGRVAQLTFTKGPGGVYQPLSNEDLDSFATVLHKCGDFPPTCL